MVTSVLNLGPQERHFLEAVPWAIDGLRQPADALMRVLENEARRFAELPGAAVVSLVTPLIGAEPRRLEELILSARCQSWGGWELLLVDVGRSRGALEVARRWTRRDPRIRLLHLDGDRGPASAKNFAIDQSRGDFLAFPEPGDVLHPALLGILARRAHLDPSRNLLFANEAVLDAGSRRVGPFVRKPPFDLFTLWRCDGLGRPSAVRRDLLDTVSRDGGAFRPAWDGVEDHDLFLRLAIAGDVKAHHEPLFLSYRRPSSTPSPEVEETRRRMIAEHLRRHHRGEGAGVSAPTPGARFASVRPGLPESEKRPTLLVVIPFQDHAEMTVACLDALERQEHDLDVHAVLVNNRSAEPDTLPTLRAWAAEGRRNRYTIADDDGPFNYARINNAAFEAHGAGMDLLLFLNNDVELESPDGLQTLAAHLLDDEGCAFAGIRLVFPGDRALQHAGIVVGEGLTGSGYHALTHAPADRGFPEDEHLAFAVTFACAMTRCRTFRELGLLEELRWPNGFGDIELCVRALGLGYRNHYFGTLVAVHHESRTRGRCVEEFELASLYERHAATIAWWRLRLPSIDPEPSWPVVLPLQYKLADLAARACRRLTGPAHDPLYRAFLALIRAAKALRRGPARVHRAAAIRRTRRDPAEALPPPPTRGSGKVSRR